MAINKFLLSRRHALISIAGFTGGLLLTSCGNKEDYETLSLGARFADGYQAPTVFTSGSPQRAPYVLISEQGWPLSEEVPDAIELIVTEINSEETIFEGKVHRHGEPGVIPYFPLIFDPPRSGEYKVEGRGMDGHHQLIVTDPSDIQLIQIGQKMPSIQTPTMQNNLEINPICTKSSGIANEYIKTIRKLSQKSTFITNKLPLNFLWIGLIKICLPNSKIIHCIRNNKDTCLSIFKTHFGSASNRYAYNLVDLGNYYNLYEDLMKHWNKILPNFIYEMSYEKLISNQKKQTKELLDACNLEWSNKCIEFNKNIRPVKTASSLQVRKSLYKDSVNSWKNYKKHLKPLIEILD